MSAIPCLEQYIAQHLFVIITDHFQIASQDRGVEAFIHIASSATLMNTHATTTTTITTNYYYYYLSLEWLGVAD